MREMIEKTMKFNKKSYMINKICLFI